MAADRDIIGGHGDGGFERREARIIAKLPIHAPPVHDEREDGALVRSDGVDGDLRQSVWLQLEVQRTRISGLWTVPAQVRRRAERRGGHRETASASQPAGSLVELRQL